MREGGEGGREGGQVEKKVKRWKKWGEILEWLYMHINIKTTPCVYELLALLNYSTI